MLFIAWKNLSRERGRFWLSIGGVAFSVLLIVVLSALYQGWSRRFTAYIESIDADLWVAQAGSGDMSHTFSLVPRALEGELSNVAGVAQVERFVGRRLTTEFEGDELTLYVVGFDTGTGRGGPVRLIAGNAQPGERELVIDRSLATKRGVSVGDFLPLENDTPWKVVGIASGGNQALFTYAFISLAEADRLFEMGEYVNYFLVTTADGANADEVARAVAATTPVKAMPKAEFVELNRSIIREAFLPIIFILLIISFAIGVMIVGLTIYTATIERAAEYGVLKALGFDAFQLYRIVFLQSFLASLVGYGIGVAAAFALAQVVGSFEPSFITLFRLTDLALALALTVLMALVAAWLPTRRIATIDPAETFRA